MTTKNMDDPNLAPLAHVIMNFPWWDYGLDDVGFVPPEHADYAWDLAARIQDRFNRPYPGEQRYDPKLDQEQAL